MAESALTPSSTGLIKSGYSGGERFLGYLFEKGIALFMLLLASPLFIILPILIKLQDGGSVFYGSYRLGKDKKPFRMIKFRTLVENAEVRVGGRVLSPRERLETPIGRFLRDTRIDEIPQLINVIRGDMAFFGPRPERQAVYEAQCQEIPGYDKRFEVRPGLVGFSQLFTPHSSPKKLRALVDNLHLKYRKDYLYEVRLLIFAFWHMGQFAAKRFLMLIWNRFILSRRVGQFIEQRTFERIRPKGLILSVSSTPDEWEEGHILVDVNEECMLIYATRNLEEESALILRMVHHVPPLRGRRAKVKTIHCQAQVVRTRLLVMDIYRFAHVLHYNPASPFNHYLLDKYLIQKSIL